jgi:hypothetical protein
VEPPTRMTSLISLNDSFASLKAFSTGVRQLHQDNKISLNILLSKPPVQKPGDLNCTHTRCIANKQITNLLFTTEESCEECTASQ